MLIIIIYATFMKTAKKIPHLAAASSIAYFSDMLPYSINLTTEKIEKNFPTNVSQISVRKDIS